MSNAFNGCPISPLRRRKSSMIDRRAFINTGLMASAVVGAVPRSRDLGASSTAPTDVVLPLHLAISIPALRIAAGWCGDEHLRRSLRRLPWRCYESLVHAAHPVWRSRPISIAGMTTQGVLFVSRG